VNQDDRLTLSFVRMIDLQISLGENRHLFPFRLADRGDSASSMPNTANQPRGFLRRLN
jgi:hypothetical protein